MTINGLKRNMAIEVSDFFEGRSSMTMAAVGMRSMS